MNTDPSANLFDFADSVICNCRSLFICHGQEIGLGLGGTYIHIDMRPYYSYWVGITATHTNHAFFCFVLFCFCYLLT